MKTLLTAILLLSAIACDSKKKEPQPNPQAPPAKTDGRDVPNGQAPAKSALPSNQARSQAPPGLPAQGVKPGEAARRGKNPPAAQAPKAKAETPQERFQNALNERRIKEAYEMQRQNSGIDPAVADSSGYTFLMLLAENGLPLRAALKAPSVRRAVNAENAGGTALTIAISHKRSLSYMKPLLDAIRENPPNKPSAAFDPRTDPLWAAAAAARPDIVAELLKHPYFKENINRIGVLSLESFSQERRVRFNQRQGGSRNTSDEIMWTALHNHVDKSCPSIDDPLKWKVAELLLAGGADPWMSYDNGSNAILEAFHCLGDLRTAEARRNKEPIDSAFRHSAYDALFKEGGIQPLDLNANGEFYILAALARKAKPTAKIMQLDPETADQDWLYILGKIPNIAERINRRNGSGETVLFLTAEYGLPRSAKWLLEKGADPLISDNSRISPLYTAMQNHRQLHQGHLSFCFLYHNCSRGAKHILTLTADELLKSGAVLKNLSEREFRYFPLHETVLRLVDAGMILKARSLLKTETAQQKLAAKPDREMGGFQYLLQRNRGIRIKKTPLIKMIEAEDGSLQAVSLLLEAGADPTIPDIDGDTPLISLIEWRAKRGNSFSDSRSKDYFLKDMHRMAAKLLTLDAVRQSVNAVNNDGDSALSLMDKIKLKNAKDFQLIELLKANGARLPNDLPDENPKKPDRLPSALKQKKAPGKQGPAAGASNKTAGLKQSAAAAAAKTSLRKLSPKDSAANISPARKILRSAPPRQDPPPRPAEPGSRQLKK